ADRCPLEAVQQLREPEVDGGERERLARAGAPPRAERREAEVAAEHADVLLREPLRPELVGLRPELRVVRDGPHVDHGRGARGDHVAADVRVAHGEARPRQERARRVHAERLLHDALEVAQAGDVAVRHGAPAADDGVELRLRLRLDVRVQHHPRHDPFQQNRHRVRPPKDHLLH
ncbi:Os03g0417750, partial [Oryza sativa Japonica Group]